ncbi:putative kinesin-like protein [Podospora australis]|uniref:Kinesin-like protein n=1 Tax=Podospora australis TaxID=1536484 RepID=A0AAN7AIR6_9PEZI|nr:putative kinesin-like protein [Podospora australis]
MRAAGTRQPAMDPNASSITVAVRVRPFTIREAAQLVRNDDSTVFLGDGSLAAAPTPKLHQRGLRPVIKVVDDRCLVFDPPEDNPVQKFSRSVVPKMGKKVKDQVFAFDRVFDENATQADLYEGTTRGLLDSVLDGYNATVFAYGATGCGKTHTITGTAQSPGIIFLTMQELFEKIQDRSDEKHTEITLSYLEIYNETIRDLLVPGGSKQGLMLREDSNQAVSVPGLTSYKPQNVQEVMDMIVQGNEYRTVSPTAANAVSSRSHAVLQINVAQKDRNADINEPHTMATLSIIDLAGSERASATKNRGERLIEGANINKSLLALGSCINALCDPRKKNHVPYRNSKLTRLLKFSLGGNCKTVMIVCVSPSSEHFDETQNTLRYANRAKNIQTKVTRNVFNVNRHVKDFLVKIDEQMALINELKAQQRDSEKIFFAKFQKQMDKRDGVVKDGMSRLRAAYENAAQERQEKVNLMKKLKAFERRIGLLSAWIAAFDAACDARGDEDTIPSNLTAMRKTAHGILTELESSRHHIRQKMERSNWERALDSALHHSIAQLPKGDGISDKSERDALTREAESLKATFMRDAYWEVLDQDKAGDAAVLQVLLTAQFEILSSLSETLNMNEEEAVAHAKGIINRLLETGYSAASHVVKPDGSMMPVELFPPTKRGTPKRKKSLSMHTTKPIPAPGLATMSTVHQQVLVSPMKASPRRRKAGTARKGVSFTPVKKKNSVRWRDDETEEGTLADFEKTPQKFSSPEEASPDSKDPPLVRPPVPSYLNHTTTAPDGGTAMDCSPKREQTESSFVDESTLTLPDMSTLQVSKPTNNRFQAGFLSKSRISNVGSMNGSPTPPTFSLNLTGSSDNEDRPSPLRSLPVSRAANNNLSPPNGGSSSRNSLSPKTSSSGRLSPLDENEPPRPQQPLRLSPSSVSRLPRASLGSGSDSESSTLDPLKIRSALHTAKRRERLSLMTGTAASNAKRVSSIGSVGLGHRGSASYSGPTASSSNGISRHRRGSAERRRSPPISCSPLSVSGHHDGSFLSLNSVATSGSSSGAGRNLTPAQARRINMGGSLPRGMGGDNNNREGHSPGSLRSTGPFPGISGLAGGDGKNRRITIQAMPGSLREAGNGQGAGGSLRSRPSMALR